MDTINEDTLTRVFDQGLEKKYIKQIDIYGLEKSGLCRAQLKIKIDWQKHQIHISEGRHMVKIPEKWLDNGAIEVDEMTKLFREFVESENLETTWQFTFSNDVDIEKARKELGTSPATAPSWKGRIVGQSFEVSGADEMKIGCYFSEF